MSSIVNAASGTAGAIAPGEIITLYGTGIGPAPTSYMLDVAGRLATTLNGNSVFINGVPAPLLYASAGQVNAIVPYEVGTSGTATIQVTSNGVTSGAWGAPVVPSAPALFTLTGSGAGGVEVLNQDNSVNGPSNPAGRGTVIQIFATGAGLTSPPSTTGSISQSEAYLPRDSNWGTDWRRGCGCAIRRIGARRGLGNTTGECDHSARRNQRASGSHHVPDRRLAIARGRHNSCSVDCIPPALPLLFGGGRVVAPVANTQRMRVTTVAGPASDLLSPYREYARARKIGVDLAHQQDHFARHILPRVDVGLERLASAVTVAAVHAERVAELAH